MRNPLNKRLLREIKGDLGKYIVIFLLLVSSIGLISGFLVADNSMLNAYHNSFSKYNVENGHFVTEKKINQANQKAIEENGVQISEQFYVQENTDFGAKLRIFANRETVNTVCLMKGVFPSNDEEIAIDRMFADNNKLSVGDRFHMGDRDWTISGLVALPDYSCLFENNNDSMFDAVLFGVAIVTKDCFDSFDADSLNYCYVWKYDKEPASDGQEKKISEDFMKAVNAKVTLKEFIPRYENQAIQFTGEDMGSDRAMMVVLLYIIIVILAFVFAITTTNTIEKEANVIGTLRASGYTRGELLRHYMAMPTLVTIISALLGNILGYTVMKDFCASMYYGSYSLTTYETLWNPDAFFDTTVIPVLLMSLINFIILKRQLCLSPLQFLRRDLSRKKRKRAMALSPGIKFFSRFRLRVILQNLSNYIVMFVGVLFAFLLLLFGLVMRPTMLHYQDVVTENMIAQYQYLLNMPLSEMDDTHKIKSLIAMLRFEAKVETDNEDAEKFSAYTLRTTDEKYMLEDVLLYGVEKKSKYISANLGEDDVYISSAYAHKYSLQKGDTITLKEKYEDTEYKFTVTGVYPYEAGMTVFMTRKHLNQAFNLGDEMFGGYFSDTPITDIDEKYIASVIDYDALTKVSRQLIVSMGDMMWLVCGFAVLIFAVLIYLLSKIIIEKNAQSISMTKILGYSKKEIAKLYILPTTIMVLVCIVIGIPISDRAIAAIWKVMVAKMMTGWLPYWTEPKIYAEMAIACLVCYGIVVLSEIRKIGKVPMDIALKNVE